jgi:type II secretory pathway pseudopilin PulG
MSTKRKKSPLIFVKNDQGGSVLIELVIAAIIFALVVAAVAFYFIHHVGTMDNGRAQLKLQRVGSRLMEEMAGALREGKATDLVEGSIPPPTQLMITYPNASTKCFSFDDSNKDIKEGPDYGNLSPLEILDDSHIMGGVNRTHRIFCDDLRFMREGDRVIIKFSLRHDLDNGDGPDDLTINFGSTVKLRG